MSGATNCHAMRVRHIHLTATPAPPNPNTLYICQCTPPVTDINKMLLDQHIFAHSDKHTSCCTQMYKHTLTTLYTNLPKIEMINIKAQTSTHTHVHQPYTENHNNATV